MTEIAQTTNSLQLRSAPPPLPSAGTSHRPPMNPDTASVWGEHVQWWERQAAKLTKIDPSQAELSRAAELLEHLVQHAPRGEFWRDIYPQDWKAALLAAMAQFRTESVLSGTHEPNKKVLPPFDVCLKILNDKNSPHVRDLVYVILQKAEYPLNPTQRLELERHFQGTTPSELATRTAERLNFKIAPAFTAAA